MLLVIVNAKSINFEKKYLPCHQNPQSMRAVKKEKCFISALVTKLHRRVKNAAISKQTNFFSESRTTYIVLALAKRKEISSMYIIQCIDFTQQG